MKSLAKHGIPVVLTWGLELLHAVQVPTNVRQLTIVCHSNRLVSMEILAWQDIPLTQALTISYELHLYVVLPTLPPNSLFPSRLLYGFLSIFLPRPAVFRLSMLRRSPDLSLGSHPVLVTGSFMGKDTVWRG